MVPFTKIIPLPLGWKQGFATPRLPKLVFLNVLTFNTLFKYCIVSMSEGLSIFKEDVFSYSATLC